MAEKKKLNDHVLADELKNYINGNDSYQVLQIPEQLFVDEFLDIFASRDMDKIVPAWLGIAGRLHLPVDVVNTDNEVLFRIPQLLHTDVPFVDNGKPIDVGKKAISAQQIGGSLDDRVRSLYYRTIISKIGVSPHAAESREMIKAILIRYNRWDDSVESKKPAPTVAEENNFQLIQETDEDGADEW